MAERNVYIKTPTGWEQISTGGTVNNITDLTDVSVSSPVNNEFFVYNSTAEAWVNSAVIDGGSA